MKMKQYLTGYLIELIILGLTGLGIWAWYSTMLPGSLSQFTENKMSELYLLLMLCMTSLLVANGYYSRNRWDHLVKTILASCFFVLVWFLLKERFVDLSVRQDDAMRDIYSRILMNECLVTILYLALGSLLMRATRLNGTLQFVLILTLMSSFFFFSSLLYLDAINVEQIFYRNTMAQFDIAIASALCFTYGYHHAKKANLGLMAGIAGMFIFMILAMWLKHFPLTMAGLLEMASRVWIPLFLAQSGGLILQKLSFKQIKSQSS